MITGVGGQGVVTLSNLVARAAFRQGLDVKIGETLGMAHRGGSVTSNIRIGKNVRSALILSGASNVILALEPSEALRVARYVGKDTQVLLNTRPTPPVSVLLGLEKYPTIAEIVESITSLGGSIHTLDFTGLAEQVGNVQTLSMVMLGALVASQASSLSVEDLRKTVREVFPQRLVEMNLKAFDVGYTTLLSVLKEGSKPSL